MDRCAILVDTGYLLAEGGKAYCGVRGRSLFTCDFPAASLAIEDYCRAFHGLPALRTYWYDAASDGVPTEEHLLIAGLPRVKLRLGRLSGGRQKGVDSLIVHDLITLAHERAVASMYLLGGDEDLREGVAAAQRLGVQVTLLGIDTGLPNQSLTLINEADEHIVLAESVLKPHFSVLAISEEEGAEHVSAGEADDGVPHHEDDLGEATGVADAPLAMSETGIEFARAWIDHAEPGQLAELAARAPRIPRELDVQLLIAGERRFGASLRGRDDLRFPLRARFWETIHEAARETL